MGPEKNWEREVRENGRKLETNGQDVLRGVVREISKKIDLIEGELRENKIKSLVALLGRENF